jgi:hypothetical protein
MKRLLIGAIALLALAGCVRQAEPESPGEAAADLRKQSLPYADLHAAVGDKPVENPLVVRESGLAELKLGAAQEAAKARYGEPTRTKEAPGGTWWEYEGSDPKCNLRLLFAGDPAKLVQIQAWAPAPHETTTLVRALDPATRVTRKYGAPAKKLAVGGNGAEAWIYPAANVAFVVTPPDEKERRSVGAIIVGL